MINTLEFMNRMEYNGSVCVPYVVFKKICVSVRKVELNLGSPGLKLSNASRKVQKNQEVT